MTLGDTIKHFRSLRGMTQKELGDLTELSDTRIGQYEIGIRRPKDEILNRIAKALRINPKYLIDGNNVITIDEIMRTLFKIDNNINALHIKKVNFTKEHAMHPENDKFVILFEDGQRADGLNEFLSYWMDKKLAYENEEITLEEYEDWKANFPESTQYDYEPKLMNEEKEFKYHFENIIIENKT